MNMRNKKAVVVFRVLFGIFMLFSGVSGLLGGATMKDVPEPMIEPMKVLWATGIFQMIKVTEIVAGLMLVVGFLPALAAIFLAPVAVGIVVFTGRMTPSFMVMGLVVCLCEAYLGYVYWDKFKALFERK